MESDVHLTMWLNMTWKTVVHAFRQLRGNPGLTITVVLTLALCVGANAAIFSIVDTLLFRTLPFPNPQRLVNIADVSRRGSASYIQTRQTGDVWQVVHDRTSFLNAAVYGGTGGLNLNHAGTVRFVRAQRISADFFHVLGISPARGREFARSEDVANGPALAVLSDALWRSAFRADPSIVGQSIDLAGAPATVIGIMPPGFHTDGDADLWVPLHPALTGECGGNNCTIIARLHEGVTNANANARLAALFRDWARERARHLPAGFTVKMEAVPLLTAATSDMRPAVRNMWLGSLLILAIGCVNIAGVLLARSSARARDIATRLALGATARTIVAQLFCEAVLLGVLGGLAGLLLGNGLLAALDALRPHQFDTWLAVRFDSRIVVIALAAAIATSIFFALVPALALARVDIRTALASGTRSISGARTTLARKLFVVTQLALGFVLVVSAGLLIRSFEHLVHLTPGFDPANVETANLSLQDARYAHAADGARLFNQTLERIRQIPGVESAAVALNLPYEQAYNDNLKAISGHPVTTNGGLTNLIYTTAGFFETLRIPLVRGRAFAESDVAGSLPVAVVNRAFVRTYLKDSPDALSETLTIPGLGTVHVIGICGDTQQLAWGDYGPVAPLPQMYVPAAQLPDAFFRAVNIFVNPAWLVRTRAAVPELNRAMQAAVSAVDPGLPFAEFHSMPEVQGSAVGDQRYQAALFSGFAGLGLLLAAVGVYGLVAQSVAQRRREMGIRLALGASVGRLVQTAAAPGMTLASIGALAGSVLALFATKLLHHYLWGLTETDPATFTFVGVLLSTVALAASLLPALRITRLNPVETLREE
jgi:predicted permease